MKKKLLYPLILLCTNICFAQFTCPDLIGPLDGDEGVPVSSTISWTAVEGVPSYLISLGTTPGGTDILNNDTTGSPEYTPELGLPENTTVYVTITLFFFDRDDIICQVGTFRTEEITTIPLCASEILPMDGTNNIGTQPIISWNHATTATGYRLFLGTSPDNYDILNGILIENTLSYEVQTELAFETPYFVRIVPFNNIGPSEDCDEISFTTQAEVFLPDCTQLSSPADGEVNVPLTPMLIWDEVPNADGYRVSIGTSPTVNDIIDNAAYGENSIEVIDFLPNRRFYVTISPFNEAGMVSGCMQTSFSTLLGCGPVEDPVSGETVSFGPELNFPDEVALCLNEIPTTVSSDTRADGHRWYRINDDQTETLLSETESLSLVELGIYRYVAYNLVTQLGDTFECSDSKVFFVTTSEIATIQSIESLEIDGFLRINVQVTGDGDYEFAINNLEGPYQESNLFINIPVGVHTIYVRDKNGCGIVEETIYEGLTLESFPKFFTPNGDGINDFWQYSPPIESDKQIVKTISIFNRRGDLIIQIPPNSVGWDGSFSGKSLPASDYWFKAVDRNNREVIGHFTLKR